VNEPHAIGFRPFRLAICTAALAANIPTAIVIRIAIILRVALRASAACPPISILHQSANEIRAIIAKTESKTRTARDGSPERPQSG